MRGEENSSSHTNDKSLENHTGFSKPEHGKYVNREEEFHKLANFTINHLLEKIEDYGDNVQIDGFDIDYGNEVLTLKLGSLGTYVLNKQTPNRQIWMSSPVSGPSRFDWDRDANAWIYRRTEAKLHKLLEEELENLCGEPIQLS
ncbi:putative frataxin-like protein [Arabidopsis thaliana]|nr:putative frataxin-like protein [Arabidopsis thaliana]CAB77809.1 putative frataxin-like protein [Arabidopsis thaliana]